MSLDLSKFQTVFDDNFANDASLNTSIWTNAWGDADQFAFGNGCLTLSAYEKPYWQGVAFMQRATGPSAGEGYGLYQFTGYGNAGQGAGINFIMWRADNQWLDSTIPNKATELDILESWDGSRTANSVVHYYNTGWSRDDGMVIHPFHVDLSKPHTYAMDWEHDSLTYYVDGKEIYQDKTHVPLDYADGGCNEVMGAQLIGEKANVVGPTVQLHIVDMSYSVPVSAASPPPPTPPSDPANPITLGGGAQSHAAAAGETVQAGAGSDTVIAAQGLVSVTGGSGSLTFLGGGGPSTVSGGAGSATLFGGAGGGSYVGGAAGGNFLVSQAASGVNTTLTGAGAGDQLFGSASGNDSLVAGAGAESILGGGGNASITSGSAADVIFTGSGASTVQGNAGGDTIVGGSGSLDVAASNGDAVFAGGAATITGSSQGADSIAGGAGALSVIGKGGNMLVVAGSSQSTITTGSGASLIFTAAGSTSVTGGAGGMQVALGAGNAVVTEGSGAAIFDVVKGAAGGATVIDGFRPGTDKVALYGYAASERQVTSAGGSTTLNLSDGTRIQLAGVGNPAGGILG